VEIAWNGDETQRLLRVRGQSNGRRDVHQEAGHLIARVTTCQGPSIWQYCNMLNPAPPATNSTTGYAGD
jgi:hypothetical protein